MAARDDQVDTLAVEKVTTPYVNTAPTTRDDQLMDPHGWNKLTRPVGNDSDADNRWSNHHA